MGVPCEREFQCRKFCFDSKHPNKFITTQWQIPQLVYIVWRVLWALWHIAGLAYSIQRAKYDALYEGAEIKWLIYITNLSYLVLTAQSWLHAILVCYVYAARKKYAKEESIHWYMKVLWFLTTVGFDAAIVVTVLYWSLEFDGKLKSFLPIVTHCFNSAYVLIDIFIIAAPVRLLHLIYASMYGAAYVTFTIIYHVCDGTNRKGEPYIYRALDWSKPIPASIVGLGATFVALPAVHLLQFGMYSLKHHIVQTPACRDRFANKDRGIRKSSSNLEAENAFQAQMTKDAKGVVVQTRVELVAVNEIGLDGHSVEIPEILETNV